MRKAEQILSILKKTTVTDEDLLITQQLLGKTFADVYEEPEPETWVSVFRPTPTSGNRTKACFIAIKSPRLFHIKEREELEEILKKGMQQDCDNAFSSFSDAVHEDIVAIEESRRRSWELALLSEKMG